MANAVLGGVVKEVDEDRRGMRDDKLRDDCDLGGLCGVAVMVDQLHLGAPGARTRGRCRRSWERGERVVGAPPDGAGDSLRARVGGEMCRVAVVWG